MDVFSFDHYKDYLVSRLDQIDGKGRGARTSLSEAIGCQTSYVAQVLRGNAHFSLEQGEAINEFLGHSEDEGYFFLLLLQLARAGTPHLRHRFERQIEKARQSRLDLKERLGVRQSLSEQDQVIYYSSWQYGAIHALASIPKYKSVESMARYLGIETKKAAEAVEFLVRCGILSRETSGDLGIGSARIHLGNESPLIAKHHTNWRLQAIRSLERSSSSEDLHYSSVVSLSEKDTAKIREFLVKSIETIKPIIRDSPEERAQCFSVDFFKV